MQLSPARAPPSLIAMLPVSVPAPGATIDTLALTLTELPSVIGAGAVSVVVADALATVTLCAVLVDASVLISPEYAAMIECDPTAKLEVWHCAAAPLTGTALQPGNAIALSLKATVPMGVVVEAIVAVSVVL